MLIDEYSDLMKRLDTELSIKQTDKQIAGGSITQPKLLELWRLFWRRARGPRETDEN